MVTQNDVSRPQSTKDSTPSICELGMNFPQHLFGHGPNDFWEAHWKLDHHQRGVSIWLTRDAPGSDAPGQPSCGIHPSISDDERFADPDDKTKQAFLCNMKAPEKDSPRDHRF